MEHDAGPAFVAPPGLGEGRLEPQVRIERREGLEELGRDGGARDVALGGRIERRCVASEDPDRSVGGLHARCAAHQRKREDQAEDDHAGGGAAHRREYTGGWLDAPPASGGRRYDVRLSRREPDPSDPPSPRHAQPLDPARSSRSSPDTSGCTPAGRPSTATPTSATCAATCSPTSSGVPCCTTA